jgi:hypothetical protein
VLRQPQKGKFLDYLYEAFRAKGNFFSTTIHVLVSAIVKLSRTVKIPAGLKLYRGLSGKELPESFEQGDDRGHRGYMEWGFMSTTSSRETAVQQVLHPRSS